MELFHPGLHVAKATAFNLSSLAGIRARCLTRPGVTSGGGGAINNASPSVIREDRKQMLILRALPNIFLGMISKARGRSADRTPMRMPGSPFEYERDSSEGDGISPSQNTFVECA